MNIKKLVYSDWKKLRDMRLAALQSDPQAFSGSFVEEVKREELDWIKRLENPDRFFFAVEENGVLLSLVGAINTKENGWMLVAIHTLPHARGKGYAQKLIAKAFEEIKGRGASSIRLMVNTDQEEAVHIYKKKGFEIIEKQKEEKMGDGKLHESYLMESKLQ